VTDSTCKRFSQVLPRNTASDGAKRELERLAGFPADKVNKGFFVSVESLVRTWAHAHDLDPSTPESMGKIADAFAAYNKSPDKKTARSVLATIRAQVGAARGPTRDAIMKVSLSGKLEIDRGPHYQFYEGSVNAALDSVAAKLADFHGLKWAKGIAGPGYSSSPSEEVQGFMDKELHGGPPRGNYYPPSNQGPATQKAMQAPPEISATKRKK